MVNMELTDIVPWGRSLDEYRAMFGLDDNDLGKSIIGVADGPASFNRELHQRGGKMVSVDPVYRFDSAELRRRIHAVRDEVMGQIRIRRDDYVWSNITSIDDLEQTRMKAMGLFVEDLEAGKREGRYVDGSLPTLAFADASFDLALCSHYLFLYDDHLDLSEHLASVRELCRVAREVRIFPLVTLGGRRSRFVDAVQGELRDGDGHGVEIERVGYEFQRGADHMLRIRVTSAESGARRSL